MSNKEQAGAERGLIKQEVVMGVENMTGEESGLMDTQNQVYLACGSLDILDFHPTEEKGNLGQIDWGKIRFDIGDPEGEYVLDLPRDCLQRDDVQNSLLQLWLPPGDL